ncbi:YrzI family small protein [Priestia megaterium]|nr:YrzI family small protein [Priestia megaterium]
MTLNIFFLTITIKPREYSAEEIEHAQRVKELEEKMKDRKYEFYRHF